MLFFVLVFQSCSSQWRQRFIYFILRCCSEMPKFMVAKRFRCVVVLFRFKSAVISRISPLTVSFILWWLSRCKYAYKTFLQPGEIGNKREVSRSANCFIHCSRPGDTNDSLAAVTRRGWLGYHMATACSDVHFAVVFSQSFSLYTSTMARRDIRAGEAQWAEHKNGTHRLPF